eukprot:751897-Hanusia_phi.AAC.4
MIIATESNLSSRRDFSLFRIVVLSKGLVFGFTPNLHEALVQLVLALVVLLRLVDDRAIEFGGFLHCENHGMLLATMGRERLVTGLVGDYRTARMAAARNLRATHKKQRTGRFRGLTCVRS